MHLRDPTRLRLEWCVDPNDTSRHWFRMQAPSSMSIEEGLEPVRYECSLAVQTVPAAPPECYVPQVRFGRIVAVYDPTLILAKRSSARPRLAS